MEFSGARPRAPRCPCQSKSSEAGEVEEVTAGDFDIQAERIKDKPIAPMSAKKMGLAMSLLFKRCCENTNFAA
jgi:hypothetical protein